MAGFMWERIILLNLGIIACEGIALTNQKDVVILAVGLTALIVAVLLHAVNMWLQ